MVTPLAGAVEDYVGSFRLLYDLGAYFAVNVSSPNTPGLRRLQDKARLSALLGALRAENHAGKPVLVKVAPTSPTRRSATCSTSVEASASPG
jgi:dihydroorotate dehydrogenase